MPEVGVCAKLTLVPIWTPADKIRPNRSFSQGMLVTLVLRACPGGIAAGLGGTRD